MMPRISREQLDKLYADIATVVQQIDAAYEAGEWDRKIPCPRCGTGLNYRKAVDINGHRHAECPNDDCTFLFVE